MDFASTTESCRDISDEYDIDLHEDDGLTLHVSTFVKNLTVVQSYSPNTKKTLFAVEVHVNQKKFWQAEVDLPGHEGEIAQLATLTTSFVNDFSFEFEDLVTLEGSLSQLNDGRLHEFIVHGNNNVREVFWDKLYKYMTRLIHNIASNVSSEKHVTKPSKVTVILEIGVARCVYVPYDHRGEKIMQRNLPRSSSHDDDFEMDKKFEKDCMDDADCPICHHELLMLETNITRMPCSHLFHSKCLLQWLPKHNTCPLCRSPMWGPDGSIHGEVKEANGSIHGDVKE